MNLLRPQTPYQFMPPKYSRAFRPVLHFLVKLSLRFQYKVTDVQISGQEKLCQLAKDNQSILIAPNHADHADPGLMITLGRRCRFACHFMAAREGFEGHWLPRWILQHAGAFSVNREGADLSSIKMAIKILQEGKHPLVIFPEGEIYHHMEELDELNEGVASIALRAASKLAEGRKGYIVPVSIQLKHDPSVEATFSDRLSALEKWITLKPRVNDKPIDRIFGLGAALVAIKEVEFLGEAEQGNLTDRLQNLRHLILKGIEEKNGISNDELSLPKRVKALRSIIRKELMEGKEEPSNERKVELYDQLDRIFVAHQLYSYNRTYLLGDPSIDRIAETIFKLEEDVMGKASYLGKRNAQIRIDEPIDLAEFLKTRDLNGKTGVQPLTDQIQHRIEALLAL